MGFTRDCMVRFYYPNKKSLLFYERDRIGFSNYFTSKESSSIFLSFGDSNKYFWIRMIQIT